MIYICPGCGHMPTEHGPDGCTALTRAAATSPNPAVRLGYLEISGGRCGCRSMLNGELVGEDRPVVHYATTPASSLTTQGGQPVAFDIENYQPGQSIQGAYAGKEVKASLWVNKVPFEVSAPPQQRTKKPEWMVARKDGSMPSGFQWCLPVRLLAYRGDGSFGYKMQADGEGGQEVEEYILTFDGGSDWRDQQMNALAQYVQETGRAGPFRLDQGQNSGQGAAPWVIKNWKPEDAGYPPQTQTAATSASNPSAAGHTAPPPAPAAPAPPPVPQAPPVPTAPPPPPADPYTYADRYDGVKIRWKPGMADWEPVPSATPVTPVVQAQPLASTRTVVGLNPGDRMEGAARVSVEQADGREIRQAVYQGDGVIVTPQGVPTQVAAGTEPRSRNEATGAAQTPSTGSGALGIEEPASVAPGPSPAPTAASQQSVIRAAYDARSVVLVTLLCDHPDHTDPGPSGPTAAKVTLQAFYDPNADIWKQTHSCPGAKRVRVLDATAAVKAAAGVA